MEWGRETDNLSGWTGNSGFTREAMTAGQELGEADKNYVVDPQDFPRT